MILYWDRSITTNKALYFIRPNILLIDRENETALTVDTAVFLTSNFPKTYTEKIMKYDNLALKIKKFLEA
jgi:hypothetical protein